MFKENNNTPFCSSQAEKSERVFEKFANYYYDLGLSIFPLKPLNKRPIKEWSPFQKRRPTKDEINRWIEIFPNANIGIATGKINNLFVVDLDNKDAIEWYIREFYGGNEDTLKDLIVIQTRESDPNRIQIWYAYDEKNRDLMKNSGSVYYPKLDTRGDGGYVVAPESVKIDEKKGEWYGKYKFLYGREKFEKNDLPKIPTAFIDYMRKKQCEKKETDWKNSNLSQTITLPIKEGERDKTLFQISCSLVRFGLKEEIIQTIIIGLAQKHCIPPFSTKEALMKVKSAFKQVKPQDRLTTHDKKLLISLANQIDEIDGIKIDTSDKNTIRIIDNKTGEIIKEVNKKLLDNLSNIIFDEENRRIYKIKFDKNGNKIEELLENFVILPKGILVNIFTGEIEKFKIEIKANNKTLSREVALDKITTQKLEDLSLPPKNLKLITTELNRRFLNDSSIETSRCSDTIGWIDNENFIHPILTKDIDWFIMDDEHNQYAKFNPNITPEEAKQAIRTITHKLISAPYPVIVPLLFAIQTIHNPENRFLCEITGTTSTGKSVLLKTIAYLLGWKPKGWNATYNYLVRYISSFQNYPTFLDEIHLANPKTSVDIVYMLTQGEDRGRLKQSGEAKKQKSFNTSLISTGEKSIIDNIEQLSNDITPYGTIARTLTITVDKPIFSQKECIELQNLSKKSAGWLLKLWIKEHPKKDIFKEVFEKTDSILEEENIQYHCLTIFPPMSWVLDELYRMDLVTDEDYAVAKQQLQEYKKTLLNTTKEEIEINNEEKIRIMIEDYLIENKDHFENIEGDPNFRGERWGWVSEETDGLTFRVLGKPFKKILKNLHLPQRLKKSGHRPDWIDYGERWIKAVNNKRRVYIISLKKTEEKGEETQDNTTSEEFSISELVDTTPANEELANLI